MSLIMPPIATAAMKEMGIRTNSQTILKNLHFDRFKMGPVPTFHLPSTSPALQMIGLPLAISVIPLTLVRIIAITVEVALGKVSFFDAAHDDDSNHERKGNQNKQPNHFLKPPF
ncbi:hypothetical protein [Rossellomorea sp. FM04394]|uniref:hypothetical protein n=1 Tax=Rossellomorea sp. FM04394 TaxID=3243076 RepID=UPI0035A702FF